MDDMCEMVDIEVSGNHLFYANGILTHNSNSDVDLTDTSESFGLPATADFMFAIITTDELEELNQLMVKQLKNRWGAIDAPARFVIGVDRSKMKLYDVEASAQDNITTNTSPKTMPDVPVMDNTSFGKGLGAERSNVKKFGGFV